MRPATVDPSSSSLKAKHVSPRSRAASAGWRRRGGMGVRIAAGSLGAYAVAAMAAVVLAKGAPLPRAEAVVIATMIAFLIAPAVTIAAFLIRTPARVATGLGACLFALAALSHLIGGAP